jgi:hypothetical protein
MEEIVSLKLTELLLKIKHLMIKTFDILNLFLICNQIFVICFSNIYFTISIYNEFFKTLEFITYFILYY